MGVDDYNDTVWDIVIPAVVGMVFGIMVVAGLEFF